MTAETSQTTKWIACPPSELSWRDWGDVVVVYHHGSADTHQLTPLGAEAIRSLQAAPLTAAELRDRLSQVFEVESDQDLLRYLEQLMLRFDELGLVERAP